jgi:hypothetical protein
MIWLYHSPIPVGRRGIIELVSTCRHGLRGRGGVGTLWCKSGLRIRVTSIRIRMRIQSHFFTSMRIQIHIKLIRICDHWLSDLSGLHFGPPLLNYEPPKLMNFDLNAVPDLDPSFTVTLMRIRIQVPKEC